MSERKRILIMMLIMITACIGTATLIISVLYGAELNETRNRLRVTVQSQARLIESIARYGLSDEEFHLAADSTFDAEIVTLGQVVSGHENYQGFGQTGEFTLAGREGDSIVFLLRHRLDNIEQPEPVDFESELAEPMRRALNGLSGTVIGLDYRGETVMAAYEPVAVLDLGLVAKIDMAEIRAGFITVSAFALLAAFLLTAFSALVFRRVGNSVIESLSRYTKELEERIEQQRMTDENLATATVFLESSIESAEGIIIFAIDAEYRYLYFNKAHSLTMKHVYGTDISVGTDIREFMTEKSDIEMAEGFYERALSGESFSTINEWGEAERSYWEILYTPIRDKADNILGITGFSQDITERIQAAERESRFNFILKGSLNEIYIFDAETLHFVEVNRGALENLGYSMEELLLLTPLDLKPDFTARSFEELVDPLRTGTEGKIQFETVHRRKNGTLYPVEAHVQMRSGDEPIFVAFILDITERKRLESERLALERQILQAQKLESLGVLAGGIAHDFNNLLMTILGNADIARQDLSPHAPARASIETIVTTAHRASELSKQMLAYSGKGRLVNEPIEMNSFVEEMTHLLDVSMSKKAILKYNFGDNLPVIHGDATQIRQVIMNLIINSSEAIGDRSGVISLSTGTQDCDQEYLSAPDNLSLAGLDESLPEGLYVYLEVADTGCGMDRETQGKLFDPFFTTKFTGRGLGMAAILGIVRGHQGMIKVYSEVNQGTTIKVLFPASQLDDVDEGVATDAKAFADWRGEGMILIADDEETVLAITKKYLERLGFEVITAVDGREAIDLFRKHSKEIVCVLLDMTMPHADGKEAFREIRKIRRDATVILCSGYNEQDAIQSFVGKGLAGFIQKPYRVSKLQEVLMEVL